MFMDLPGIRMLEVGFSAILATISCPLEIPPRIPPVLLLMNPSGVISSLCSVPFWLTDEKPEPISTPFTALMLINALAISASSLSKMGSPSPAGTLDAWTLMRAPTELPSLESTVM